MKKALCTSLIFSLIGIQVVAQQINRRTQFVFNPYMVNPAVAGTENQTPFFLSYRNQWAGFKGAPTTFVASGHMQGPKNSGFGAIITHDDTGGAISETGLEATGAYHIDLNNYDAVSFGLSLSASQFKFDNSKLVVYDNNDQALNGGMAESHLNVDATFGLMIYGKNYFAGFSIPQMLQSKLNLESAIKGDENRNARHFQFMGSYKYNIDEDFDIQLSSLLKFTQVTPGQIELNTKVGYQEVAWAGLTYRHNDALGVLLGGFHKNIFLGYSYDFTITQARRMSPHTHEVLIGYVIPGKRGKYQPKGVLGPRVLSRSRIEKRK